ncbi:MAG TPA: transketolase C-terminal domain-containing protein [Candidatus Methylomirabilis sp.]|nr:transketolase C-terminal domain-containing protein [Candidatus Methylomirabilis sp.]
MRKAFAQGLIHAASADERVIFLTGDLGFQVFDEFRRLFGPRYINVGVAEAQMMCAAAGLALEGWRPVAYSIASFATARAFEQIRISINYPGLPVLIVGAGGGYFYSHAGVTHHAADDLGLMSLLPGMTVVAPGSGEELSQLLPQIFRLAGPCYLRIGGFGEPAHPAQEAATLGRARTLRDGEELAVVSTGSMASVVIQALDVLCLEGFHPAAIQMHTVKPLDTAALDRLAGRVRTLVVVEEHVPAGGLAAAVDRWAAGRGRSPHLVRLGPSDTLALGNLHLDELRRRMGYDAQAIAAACREALRRRHPAASHAIP